MLCCVLTVSLWSAAASPCWLARRERRCPGAPRCCTCPLLAPCAAHALLLLPCAAQFLLLELADGTYAMMLPLISHNTFRGTLRPPRQAACYCCCLFSACCGRCTLRCMPRLVFAVLGERWVYKGGAVTYKQKSAAALSCAVVGHQLLWLLLGLLGCLLWRDACPRCLSAALSHSKLPVERHRLPERAWRVTAAGPASVAAMAAHSQSIQLSTASASGTAPW